VAAGGSRGRRRELAEECGAEQASSTALGSRRDGAASRGRQRLREQRWRWRREQNSLSLSSLFLLGYRVATGLNWALDSRLGREDRGHMGLNSWARLILYFDVVIY
jgi:hypothetical protein